MVHLPDHFYFKERFLVRLNDITWKSNRIINTKSLKELEIEKESKSA
jgi:hypothetical protein